MAIDGSAVPAMGFRDLYSSSVMVSQVPRAWSPSHSSLYAASHFSLSSGGSLVCWDRDDGAAKTLRPFAEIWQAIIFEAARICRVTAARRRFFHPWNSFLW